MTSVFGQCKKPHFLSSQQKRITRHVWPNHPKGQSHPEKNSKVIVKVPDKSWAVKHETCQDSFSLWSNIRADMVSKSLLSNLVILGLVLLIRGEDLKNQRHGKQFSLFNIITFEQTTCNLLSDSTLQGTCLTTSECVSQGGTVDGNCAAGFGSCCLFEIKSNTGTITKNCTYIQNPEYPSTSPPSQESAFTFSRIAENLCQIRLDFENFESAQPPSAPTLLHGDCATSGDFLTITSPTQSSPPVTCGTLTGQHMYFETGDSGTAGIAEITYGASPAMRTFKIKVTFYECDNLNKAPADCVQYITGQNGQFESYNFQGGQLINNQNYVTCIRREEGYCTIQYSEASSTTSPAFDLYEDDGFIVPGDPRNAKIDATTCPTVVQFGSTATGSGSHCGGVLNTVLDSNTPGSVIGTSSPFRVTTIFGDMLGIPDGPVAGYSLQYAQIPC
ncbi:uncharacterized protein LOC131883389 [Tigriopus californicus]|uniref:uncharacterized protein LOC131883389 n=1 Tax=Tigriopus californicus TaxID=6832 RepID=UPI0027DAA4C9|nr:uncharacterized protein LOC131883389 [Tigriopus californicus]